MLRFEPGNECVWLGDFTQKISSIPAGCGTWAESQHFYSVETEKQMTTLRQIL